MGMEQFIGHLTSESLVSVNKLKDIMRNVEMEKCSCFSWQYLIGFTVDFCTCCLI